MGIEDLSQLARHRAGHRPCAARGRARASPALGAAIFGLPLPPGSAAGYVPAIGVRDIAFDLYILAPALLSSWRAVGSVLALTALIPVGDILVLVVHTGLSSRWHLALHGVSGLYMAAAAAWVLGTDSGRKGAST